MAFRDFSAHGGGSYTMALTLVVDDAEALWTAAAERAMRLPGMTLADVIDTIGPREDPIIADCIALLTEPQAIPGCALDSFGVRETAMAKPAQWIAKPSAAAIPTADYPASHG